VSLFAISKLFGFPSLYATLVCVACSQLEKLRTALLDMISDRHVLSEEHCGDETDQQKIDGEAYISAELIQHMRNKLNKCIR
jgi:hypothetical protein